MESLRFFNRQAVSMVVAIGMLLALAAPGFVSMASAELLTERSIAMSTSAIAAEDVSYDVTFTVDGAAGAFIIDFCKNSAVINTACTAPDGFSTASVSTETEDATASSVTISAVNRAVKVVMAEGMDAESTVNVVLDGIDNPTYLTNGTDGFYARILTYADSTAANGYTAATTIGSPIDGGSVPLATTSAIGVTASVRENMIFCVANQTITANCGDAGTLGHEPNIVLGTGGSLDASRIDTGSVFAQITTNAVSGAVINLKSSATGCGGLMLFGSSVCHILPSTNAGFTLGNARFGVKTGTATGTSTASGAPAATGTLQPVGDYGDTNYFMDYVEDDEVGVTSPYGSPILDTDDAPINNQNMELIFGASISANTPAGSYSATLNMIATGKF